MTNPNNMQLDPRIVDVGGKHYMSDAKGALVPVEMIKPLDRLMDETIDKIFKGASDQRFRSRELPS